MMFAYRVTKYDPQKRNADGHFLAEDWISVSEIGQTFDGKTLSVAEYLEAENAYVESVKILLANAGITSMRVTDLAEPQLDERTDLGDGVVECRHVKDGQTVSGADLENLIRACLRECVWCRLAGPDGSYVHFGYDYYMYVGVPRPANGLPLPNGVFLEEFESPYMSLDTDAEPLAE